MRLEAFFLAQTLWVLGANASTCSPPGDGLPIEQNITMPNFMVGSNRYGAPPAYYDSCNGTKPIIFLHGLCSTRNADLNILQWNLTDAGRCTFSQTYGAYPIVPWVGGMQSMNESAKDIADWIRHVLSKTGAAKVDIIGHSEGAVQALYVPLTQPGISDIVDNIVALAPAIHGAQYHGFTDFLYIGDEGSQQVGKAVHDSLGCPACDDLMTGGEVANKFQESAGKIVQPGNKVTIISSKADKLVSPDASRIDENGVKNIVVQDTCPDDQVGHVGLAYDKGVRRMIYNALLEKNDTVYCDTGLNF
ncbi:alpha/beta-hydrolase [Hypoxylon sp. FL1857]|nr:alpha/beta-hydrolase [Hypoxylon sp. FL1857]